MSEDIQPLISEATRPYATHGSNPAPTNELRFYGDVLQQCWKSTTRYSDGHVETTENWRDIPRIEKPNASEQNDG